MKFNKKDDTIFVTNIDGPLNYLENNWKFQEKGDLTEVTFTDYEGCDIDTSSIKFNSFELIALESSFNITIEGLHPSYAYASRYVILEEDL